MDPAETRKNCIAFGCGRCKVQGRHAANQAGREYSPAPFCTRIYKRIQDIGSFISAAAAQSGPNSAALGISPLCATYRNSGSNWGANSGSSPDLDYPACVTTFWDKDFHGE
jgi:hypothetical protein